MRMNCVNDNAKKKNVWLVHGKNVWLVRNSVFVKEGNTYLLFFVHYVQKKKNSDMKSHRKLTEYIATATFIYFIFFKCKEMNI